MNRLLRLASVPLLMACLLGLGAAEDQVLCSEDECHTPTCVCASNFHTIPVAIKRPQIVTITFDDEVTESKFATYLRLFNNKRRNPNGCPISATFFVSDQGINRYDLVRQLYEARHEIASHSVTHPESYSWWGNTSQEELRIEMVGMRELLVKKAAIPAEEIRGMRMPFLILRGDEQLRMMKQAGFLYDSSCMAGPYSSLSDQLTVWPFTWDYPITWKYCDTKTLPKRTYPGIWELPLNRWLTSEGDACIMVDGCQSQDDIQNGSVRGFSGYVSPPNVSEVLRYMWKNFDLHYKRGRMPLGMHMHGQWFREEYRLEAMERFLDGLLERKDVYIVTMYQLIQWIQNEVPLKDVDTFEAWRTSCKDPGGHTNPPPPKSDQPIKNDTRNENNSEHKKHVDPYVDDTLLYRLPGFNSNENVLEQDSPRLKEGSFWPFLFTSFAVLFVVIFIGKYFVRQRRHYRRQR